MTLSGDYLTYFFINVHGQDAILASSAVEVDMSTIEDVFPSLFLAGLRLYFLSKFRFVVHFLFISVVSDECWKNVAVYVSELLSCSFYLYR